ncbi:hypothetical protein HAX54_010278 [Datura stramonium]|uniref:DUF7610 domain-containing protein n=1 Tax=Datura stramonium TaxID=4076 RepID=A0ABS8THT2_DATST|nr:hypothetical protein [Datura stramonium]
MTKRYGILRKKLEKLESDLHLLFTFPPDTATHEILSRGIEQQLEFLNHLLAAEIASCPSKPRHLRHITRRLHELETAFLHWDDYRNINDDHDAAASVCSCSESCLNEDREAAVERDFAGSPVNYDVPEDSPVKGVEYEEEVDGEGKAAYRSAELSASSVFCGMANTPYLYSFRSSSPCLELHFRNSTGYAGKPPISVTLISESLRADRCSLA